tara:strand:- start:268 stop:435 length:168 start_codon:yes stop_codon:yes gene_type:complete
VSKILEKIDPNINIIGNKQAPRSGAFEVTLNDKLIFSKFESGTFPDKEIIKNWFN